MFIVFVSVLFCFIYTGVFFHNIKAYKETTHGHVGPGVAYPVILIMLTLIDACLVGLLRLENM